MKNLMILAMLALIVAVTVGLSYTPASAIEPAQSAQGGKIAFVSDRDGNGDIYVMNADGSEQTRLTNTHPYINVEPDWSPDGSRIVFASGRDKRADIYVMNADGSEQTRLTDVLGYSGLDEFPSWSPDGRRIAFASYPVGADGIAAADGEIYVMNADGSGRKQLTEKKGVYKRISWSPDGRYIAFSAFRLDNGAYQTIYVMNVDGTRERYLTNQGDEYVMDPAWWPAWSPDGLRIAFEYGSDIYVINVDGSGQKTNLTNNEGSNSEPTWSPDGQRIAFISNRSGNDDIWVMNADGTGLINLTNSEARESEPSWQPSPEATFQTSTSIPTPALAPNPNAPTPTSTPATTLPRPERTEQTAQGGKIAFTSFRDDDDFLAIYAMDANGKGLVKLTNLEGTPEHPTWSPDGRRIAFSLDGEIYAINADGTGLVNLTNFKSTDDSEPSWSPDGRRIVFVSYDGNREGNSDIYVMNADGSEPARLTTPQTNDLNPSWSPDGLRIAFTSWDVYIGLPKIYVMNADGSEPARRLTNDNDGWEWEPSWSPDGQRIAYRSEHDYSDIYVINVDGSERTQLTYSEGFDSAPTWSPDGRHIAFVSDRDGVYDIWVMGADGSRQQNLTNSEAWDENPSWQPELLDQDDGKPVVNIHGQLTSTRLGGAPIKISFAIVHTILMSQNMTAHLQVTIPNGWSIAGAGFAKACTGICNTVHPLKPGDNRNLEVEIIPNQTGRYRINAKVEWILDDGSDSDVLDTNIEVEVLPKIGSETPTPPTPVTGGGGGCGSPPPTEGAHPNAAMPLLGLLIAGLIAHSNRRRIRAVWDERRRAPNAER